MKEAGLSTALRAAFVNPVFLEQVDSRFPIPQEEHSIFGYVWYLIRNPWALFFSKLGMRRPGQKDSMGRKCLNLNQLALHGIVEHDVSLTRYDYNQGDNHSPQPNLIQELLASSADGKTLTADDLAALRKRRIEEQKQDNPELKYGSFEHTLGCGEIALILNVLGDGQSVPCDYIRAFFEEERLPVEEGWAKRSSWWPFGLVELVLDTTKIKRLMGIKV